MYIFPLVAFFLFGKHEGSFWSILVFLSSMVLLWIPIKFITVYAYPNDYKIRFIITYLAVSLTSYWFEFFRDRFRRGMEKEKYLLEQEKEKLHEQIRERLKAENEKEKLIIKLQDALEVVKQMTGLIPICTYCHKIRDDSGYWKHFETYLKEHSDAEFSHGLCPDCTEKFYPELNYKR
jgi:hypothetical protein